MQGDELPIEDVPPTDPTHVTGVEVTGPAPEQRGVISGLLNLSRNLGLITGASVMGAVFAAASSTIDITTAPPAAVAIRYAGHVRSRGGSDARRARHRRGNVPP